MNGYKRSFTVFPLLARTAVATSADVISQGEAGVRFDINVTAITGTTPTITFTVQWHDATDGTWRTLIASAAISAAGTATLQVDPRIPAAANAAVQAIPPKRLRVVTTHGGTVTSVTFGVIYTGGN